MGTESVTYGGYTIEAKPAREGGSGSWSAVLTISRGSGKDKESWLVSASDIYESREEAVTSCFAFARELIDKEMKGCSLD